MDESADTTDPTKALQSVSSATDALPAVPSLRDEEAWQVEATPEQAADAVSAVEAMTTADMGTDAIGRLGQMIMRRGYTQAELAYAMEELMYDDELAEALRFRDQKHILPSDFERIISKHREMRRRIEQLLDRYEMNRLINDFPGHLSRSDFGIAGYTVKDKPLFRFKQNPDTADGEVRPKLEEDPRPGADRERSGEDSTPIQVGEAMEEAIGDPE
jgi:hypothetical protein